MVYPQTRSVWDISENQKGTVGRSDPAALSDTFVASETIPFGRLVAPGATKLLVDKPTAGDTSLQGITLVDNRAGDYANLAYLLNDDTAVALRGFYWVEVDPLDVPAVGSTVLVSTAVDKEGMLVGTPVAGVTLSVDSGIRIVSVLDSVAEVYLDGSAQYPVTVTV